MCFDFCFLDNFQLVILFNPQWSHILFLLLCCSKLYIYVMLYQLLGYVVIFVWRPYYICLCWFCYIELTQFNFLTADMNCISYTIWRCIQNQPTYQISYAYINSVSTEYYDSRISFSLILHRTTHMKKQGRLLLASVVTDYMWKLYVKYL